MDPLFTPENFCRLHNLPASIKTGNNSGTGTPPPNKSLPSAPKKKNWKTLVVNINGLREKKAAMQSACDHLQSDVIISCETKIKINIFTSEILPQQYVANTYRKDGASHGGGGGGPDGN